MSGFARVKPVVSPSVDVKKPQVKLTDSTLYSVISRRDTIGKGGAHTGVQNMNLMFGLDENTELTRAGLHPYERSDGKSICVAFAGC